MPGLPEQLHGVPGSAGQLHGAPEQLRGVPGWAADFHGQECAVPPGGWGHEWPDWPAAVPEESGVVPAGVVEGLGQLQVPGVPG